MNRPTFTVRVAAACSIEGNYQLLFLAITKLHLGGGLAARTPGVLTMHATSRTTGVGATDS